MIRSIVRRRWAAFWRMTPALALVMAGTATAANDPSPAASATETPGETATAIATATENGPKLDRRKSAARYSPADFARIPAVRSPLLSPDGAFVLFRSQVKGKTVLVHSATDFKSMRVIAIPERFDLNWFSWAGAKRILISLGRPIEFQQKVYRKTNLIVVDADTLEMRPVGKRNQGLEGDDVLYTDPDGRYVLLSIQPSNALYPTVYRASLIDDSFEKVQGQAKGIWEWFADSAGVVRLGMAYAKGGWRIYYRSSANDDFEKTGFVDYDDAETGNVSGWKLRPDSDQGYVLSDQITGRFALHRFDFATRTLGELVYGDDKYDIDSYTLNEDGTPKAVYYYDDRYRTHWFDPKKQALQDALDKAVAPLHTTILDSGDKSGRKLVFAQNASDPGAFYLLDEVTGTLSPFSNVNEAIAPASLSETRSVRYTARDGTDIPAYLTMPKGYGDKGLPLIIMPHGGPFGIRDSLSFDSWAQFLASRGYVVLQPNYRGSGGYGSAYVELGEGQIGRAMQDDLDDGMDWLARQGTIDPRRVCVVGASYGGYAALWAVTRNPERYRCAASFAGVTDFDRILRYDSQFLSRTGSRRLKDRIRGERSFDLDAVSPLSQVARLGRPVLIGQGDDDSVVPESQAKYYVKALEQNDKIYEYKLYEGEGHGFSDPENAADWLERLEAFLERYNPASVPPT